MTKIIKTPLSVPKGIDEIISVYGDPDRGKNFTLDLDWAKENLIKERLPFPLRLSYNLDQVSYNIYGNKYVVPLIIEFFKRVEEYYGGYQSLKEQDLDIWGGCFSFRYKRRGGDLSTHSFGIAFDYLPQLGPYGQLSQIPEAIVVIAEKLGFENGGSWEIPDGMHFQYCRDY